MRNIKLTIEYDGKDFNGWQKQKNKLNIQGEIEKAIETITGEEIELIASGRTDAGVHSLGQTANFKTESTIQIEKIPIAINSQLKKSIRIKSAEEVEENFHSRYNCKRKTYRYTINNSEQGSAIYRNLEYHMPQKLNFEEMKKALKYFETLRDTVGQSFVLRGLGRVFSVIHKKDSAVFYYEKALSFGNEVTKRSIYNELGGVYLDLGLYSLLSSLFTFVSSFYSDLL